MVFKDDAEKYPFTPRATKPGIPVHIRQPLPPGVEDIEKQPYKYIALALVHLRQVMARLPVMIEDYSHPVDEYQPQTVGVSPVETAISVTAQWEDTEIIRAVLITGPAGTVTVQLGDRTWPLTIPATGFLLISPIWMILERGDPRTLTAGTPGDYTLELMGHEDTRGNLV